MSIYICVCFNYEAEILDDWNNIRSSGYGMGKRSNQNERIAQWIIADQKFEGGVYSSLFEACDYQDKKQRVQMMTWNVLCAAHTQEAVVDVRVCMVIMCVCWCVCKNFIHQAVEKCFAAGELIQEMNEKGVMEYGFPIRIVTKGRKASNTVSFNAWKNVPKKEVMAFQDAFHEVFADVCKDMNIEDLPKNLQDKSTL
jgi:hypothetical protein